MNAKLRKWMPIALCCLPGVAIVAIVGIRIATGGAAFGTWLGGPLGLGLIVLAMLACPVSMGLMMWRGSKEKEKSLWIPLFYFSSQLWLAPSAWG